MGFVERDAAGIPANGAQPSWLPRFDGSRRRAELMTCARPPPAANRSRFIVNTHRLVDTEPDEPAVQQVVVELLH